MQRETLKQLLLNSCSLGLLAHIIVLLTIRDGIRNSGSDVHRYFMSVCDTETAFLTSMSDTREVKYRQNKNDIIGLCSKYEITVPYP